MAAANLSPDAHHLIDMLDGTCHEILYNLKVYRPVKDVFKPQRVLGKVIQRCKIEAVTHYIYSSIERAYLLSQSSLHLVLAILDENKCVTCRFNFDICLSADAANGEIGEDGFKTIFQRLTASLMMRWPECITSSGTEPCGFKILFYSDDALHESSRALSKNDVVVVQQEERNKLEFQSTDDQDGDENMGGTAFVQRTLPVQRLRGFQLMGCIELAA